MPSQSDVARFHAANPTITKILENGKLHFTQTGHDFAPNTSTKVLEAYATGKAYRRAVQARENVGYDFEQHQPYIVPHKFKDEAHFLYCKLTNVTLPKMKTVIEAHVSGKRYKRRLNEIQQEKERQEKAREKKKVARQKARKNKEEQDMKDGEDDQGEGQDEEGEDSENDDVLNGIVSQSESDDDDEGNEEEQQDVEMEDPDAIEREAEDAAEDKGNVFWTRGRTNRAEMVDSDDEDDADEWGGAAESKQPVKANKPKRNISTTKVQKDPTSEVGEGSGTKRKLSEKKVTKKRRRPRQKQKLSESSA